MPKAPSQPLSTEMTSRVSHASPVRLGGVLTGGPRSDHPVCREQAGMEGSKELGEKRLWVECRSDHSEDREGMSFTALPQLALCYILATCVPALTESRGRRPPG